MSMRTTVLNCPVDLCDMTYALSLCSDAISENKNFQIITINPEMIMNAQKNEDFFNILKDSDLNIADGVGVRLALKFNGIKQKQIRGIDFSRALLAFAQENNLRVALLGAKDEVIQKAKEKLLETLPSIDFCYVRNGYFTDDSEIIKELKAANPQILLAGLGSPRQEQFISKLKSELNSCIMVGVGGSFDVYSGAVKESPLIFQKLGLEWLYRTLLQPERFKRIFPVLPLFLIKCIINTVQKKG